MHPLQTTLLLLTSFLYLTTTAHALSLSLSLTQPHLLTPTHPLQTYHPQCHSLTTPGIPGLNPTNCKEAADLLCSDLAARTMDEVVRDRWHWVDLPGCSAGYMFLRAVRSGILLWQCREEVFGAMRRDCAFDSRFNAGSVNVAVLPDWSQNGEPGDGERPMFMFAPERLTLWE